MPYPDGFLDAHRSMDERLDQAFARYAKAFREHTPDLAPARLDLTLLLWETSDQAPDAVRAQAELDGQALFRETPPL